MATAKKKAPSAKSASGTNATTATPSAVQSSSVATPSSTTGGGGGGSSGGGSNKKKSPPAAAAPTAVAAAPSDKTNTTAKKDQDSPPPNDEMQMTRCTEKDVLLGRGKRVSEWPGNIHFRQVVNRYREEYATSERANKVKIAAAVIAAVQDIGGRFVREIPGGAGAGRSSWYVVTHDRAVEKTCQALREKEKANPPNVSPFVGGDDMDDYDGDNSPLRQKRSRLSPGGSPNAAGSPRTKRKILHQASAASEHHADSDEESSGNGDDDDDDDSSSSSSDSDDGVDDSSTTSEDTEGGKGKNSNAKITKPSPAAAAAAAAAAALSKQPSGGSSVVSNMTASPSSREEVALTMMNRLRAFWSTHGHAAVPPIWPGDQKLADWCIQQRQLHREIMTSSSKHPANQEESQKSSIDVNNKEEIKEPLEEKESSSDQKMAENGASEQKGTANEEEDEKKKNALVIDSVATVAAATTTATAPFAPVITTATTANSPNDHHVNNKQQQQHAEPYRRGSPAELRRIEALNRLGFCWDYAAWHWDHQYKLLVAQVAPPAAPTKQDVTLQAATEKERQDTSSTQEDTKNDSMEVDGEPAKKDATEQMTVDQESTKISNGNVTDAKPENNNAMEIDQQDEGKKEESSAKDDDEGKKDAPTADTQEAAASTAACHSPGLKDGILCTRLTDETLEWIDDQQDQYHNQAHQLVSKERRDKLQAMGIYF